MKLIDFQAIGPEGKSIPVKVNPKNVCLITIAMVPGNINGPDGCKILKPGTAIDFGGNTIIVDCQIGEVQKKLEQEE